MIQYGCLRRVDFFVPGVEKVGGFSMCSSPGLLQREGIIELAVKYSKHPPAHWVHTMVRRQSNFNYLLLRSCRIWEIWRPTLEKYSNHTLGEHKSRIFILFVFICVEVMEL